MSFAESRSDYFADIKTATRADGEEAELQWDSISESLTRIAEKLRALSELMKNRGSKPPNLTNLDEIEDILEQLYPTFKTLKKWIKGRNKQNEKWIRLLSALGEITNESSEVSEIEIKGELGDYMQKVGKKERENKKLIKQRILVGIMLSKLAEQIDNSLIT